MPKISRTALPIRTLKEELSLAYQREKEKQPDDPANPRAPGNRCRRFLLVFDRSLCVSAADATETGAIANGRSAVTTNCPGRGLRCDEVAYFAAPSC